MPIYLDYNATTPVDERVFTAMQPYFSDVYGNPSSRDHAFGWAAAEVVEDARLSVATAVNGKLTEITFTSGATESLNAALHGFVGFRDWDNKKIVTCATEHEAVLSPSRRLSRCASVEVQVLPVDGQGYLDLDTLKAALQTDKKVLVALMLANNEIGTIHAIGMIAQIAHAAGALFLCDMTQAVGIVPVDVRAEGVDVAAFSAHKLYGPKGIGALFIHKGDLPIELEPFIIGGGQECRMRGGTLNVPGIVGFGEACRITQMEMDEEASRIQKLRDRLEQTLVAELPDIWINGQKSNRLPNTSNIGFAGVDARPLIRDMNDIAVSTRSACSSSSPGPSHVLKALGLTDDQAYSCVRFSLGRFTTDAEIDYAINKVISSVRRLRIHRVIPNTNS